MSDGSSAILLLRMVFSLVVVLAALLLLVRFLQRRQGGAIRTSRKANVPVRVLTRTSLSRNASIQVIEIGRETLVLGVSDAGVNVLREIPADQVLGETLGNGVGSQVSGQVTGVRAEPGLPIPPALLGRTKTGQAAQQAFDLMLSRVASKQAQQADTLDANLPTELTTRRGRHRG